MLTLDSVIKLHSGVFWNAFNMVGLKLKTLPCIGLVQFFLPLATQNLPHAYMVQGQPESWAVTHNWSSLSLAFSLVYPQSSSALFSCSSGQKDACFLSEPLNPVSLCWHPAVRSEPYKWGAHSMLLPSSMFQWPSSMSLTMFALWRFQVVPHLKLSRKGQLCHLRVAHPWFILLLPFLPYHLAFSSFSIFPFFFFFGLIWKLSVISLCYLFLSFLPTFIPVPNHIQPINATSQAGPLDPKPASQPSRW